MMTAKITMFSGVNNLISHDVRVMIESNQLMSHTWIFPTIYNI